MGVFQSGVSPGCESEIIEICAPPGAGVDGTTFDIVGSVAECGPYGANHGVLNFGALQVIGGWQTDADPGNLDGYGSLTGTDTLQTDGVTQKLQLTFKGAGF